MTSAPRTLAPVRYHGTPPNRVHVITAGVAIPLRHYVRHSPTGFGWGYNGSGPADLARSLLWDALGAEPHPALYQQLKRDLVACWDSDSEWNVDRDALREWVLVAVQNPTDDVIAVLATGAPVIGPHSAD